MTDFEKLQIIRGQYDSLIIQLKNAQDNKIFFDAILKQVKQATIEDLESKIFVLKSQLNLLTNE